MCASICFSAPGVKQWRLVWDPNSETDLAGYKVYYGAETGVYGAVVDVGNVTNYTATGNIPTNSYVAVTAYDLSGNESGYSDERFFDKDQVAPGVPGGTRWEEIK